MTVEGAPAIDGIKTFSGHRGQPGHRRRRRRTGSACRAPGGVHRTQSATDRRGRGADRRVRCSCRRAVERDNARTVDACLSEWAAWMCSSTTRATPTAAKSARSSVEMRRRCSRPTCSASSISPIASCRHEGAGSGDIVNIASTSGMKGARRRTSYAGSKWAVRGISQCWQAELRPHGIRVSACARRRCRPTSAGRSVGTIPTGCTPRTSRRRSWPRSHAAPDAVAGAGGVRQQPVEGRLMPAVQGRLDVMLFFSWICWSASV